MKRILLNFAIAAIFGALTIYQGNSADIKTPVADLPSLGASISSTPPPSALQTFFSPDDDCLTVLLEFVKGAQKQLLIADYSFVDPDLTTAIIAAHKRGIDVRLVLDSVQASGKSERAQLQLLHDAGVPFLIGHSEKSHIMHLKVMIRDGVDVLSGSFNFTSTAEKEDNTFDIMSDPPRTARFIAKWEKLWVYFQTQAQPT